MADPKNTCTNFRRESLLFVIDSAHTHTQHMNGFNFKWFYSLVRFFVPWFSHSHFSFGMCAMWNCLQIKWIISTNLKLFDAYFFSRLFVVLDQLTQWNLFIIMHSRTTTIKATAISVLAEWSNSTHSKKNLRFLLFIFRRSIFLTFITLSRARSNLNVQPEICMNTMILVSRQR